MFKIFIRHLLCTSHSSSYRISIPYLQILPFIIHYLIMCQLCKVLWEKSTIPQEKLEVENSLNQLLRQWNRTYNVKCYTVKSSARNNKFFWNIWSASSRMCWYLRVLSGWCLEYSDVLFLTDVLLMEISFPHLSSGRKLRYFWKVILFYSNWKWKNNMNIPNASEKVVI